MRAFVAILALVAAACGGGPKPPDWQVNAHADLGDFTAAYLEGNSRVADFAFARARAELARTGRPDLVARAELVRCAAHAASLDVGDCPGFAALAADADASELAYAAFLAGRWQSLDAALLPEQYRGLVRGDTGALAGIADPLSRLIAAGVLFRRGKIAPADIASAVDTASAQGWRRPLLAWLGVELKRAEAAGDSAAAAYLRRRSDLVDQPSGATPAK